MDQSTAQTILDNWETAAANLASAVASLASGAAASTVSVTTPGGSWSVTRENITELNETINRQLTYWQNKVDTFKNTNRRSAKQVQFHHKNR